MQWCPGTYVGGEIACGCRFARVQARAGSSYSDTYVKDDVKIRVMTCVRTCSDGAVPDVVVCVTVVRTRMLADEGSSDRCVMCTGMEYEMTSDRYRRFGWRMTID